MTSIKGTNSKDPKGHRALEATSGRDTMDRAHMVMKISCTKDIRQGSFVNRMSTTQDAVREGNKRLNSHRCVWTQRNKENSTTPKQIL